MCLCFLKMVPLFNDRRIVRSSNVYQRQLLTLRDMQSREDGDNFWEAGGKGVVWLMGSACDRRPANLTYRDTPQAFQVKN